MYETETSLEVNSCPHCGNKPTLYAKGGDWGHSRSSAQIRCKCGMCTKAGSGSNECVDTAISTVVEEWNIKQDLHYKMSLIEKSINTQKKVTQNVVKTYQRNRDLQFNEIVELRKRAEAAESSRDEWKARCNEFLDVFSSVRVDASAGGDTIKTAADKINKFVDAVDKLKAAGGE